MQYFAFLRAINVTNRFVKMNDLKSIFSNMGFAEVDTYIQSGNVIFESDSDDVGELCKLIETTLENQLGFEAPTFIRTSDEIKRLVDFDSFDNVGKQDDPSYYVSFTYDKLSNENTKKLAALNNETDIFYPYSNHILWLYLRNKGKSSYSNSQLERKLKISLTRRNIRTIEKMHRKYCE